MNKSIVRRLVFSALAVLALAACGGGGGGGGTPPNNGNTTTTQPTTAIVKLLTAGALVSNTQIGGIDVTLNLPAGVTVKATPDGANATISVTNSGVVVASGVSSGANTSVLATYASGTPGKVTLKLVNANGFGTGEFATITCDIAAGSNPTAADFSLSGFSAVDLNGAAITGLTSGFTAAIQ